MQHPIVILILIGVAIYLTIEFQRWKRTQTPAQLKQSLTRVGIYVAIAVFILLAVTGRLHWLFALIASVVGALIPLIKRLLPVLIRYLPFIANLYRQSQAAKSARGPSQGQQSVVKTDYLRMILQHDSGEIYGEILKGKFQGKNLGDLQQEELIAFLDECKNNDTDAIPLIEAYLDRQFGAEWRTEENTEQEKNNYNNAPSGEMSKEEAYAVLGLKPTASKEEIIAAHRHLIARFHPDRGGSNYLASKINQAKDILLAD